MTRVKAFQEMLRQMSNQFTVPDIVSVIFVMENADERAFMLNMSNGEYWFVSNYLNSERYRLYKYPAPIPAISDLPGLPTQMVQIVTKPTDLAYFLSKNGKATSLFMKVMED